MEADKRLDRYRELFSEQEQKAAAFDELAQYFYAGNFGSMGKSDIETLMFSLYLERILERQEKDYSAYSDFQLAKELGVTQGRISSLKEKKQLKYPHPFDWRESFARVSEKARYDKGKIKIQIPDVNLYYEIKNAVEESGGFIEVTLTKNLLQISPEYFLDLLVAVAEEKDRKKLRSELRKTLRSHTGDQEFLDEEPLGAQLAGLGRELVLELVDTALGNITGVDKIATIVKIVAENVAKRIPHPERTDESNK